jgi:hypothetical protein
MARRLSYVLLALVLAAGALLLWSDGEDSGRAVAPAPVAAAVSPVESLPSEVEPGVGESRTSLEPEPELVEVPVPAPSPGPEEVEAPVVIVKGSVTVVDGEQGEHLAESGTMELHLWRDGTGGTVEVEVTNGSWTCEAPEDARLSVASATLGGRAAFGAGEWHETVAIPPDRFVALRVRWPRASVLFVRAADTGRELDGIELLSNFRYPEGEGAHPGRVRERNVVASDARSPIELALEPGGWNVEKAYFARAPGYAWGQIEIDHSRGGDRWLELLPAGDLAVSFRGSEPAKGALLVLARGEEHEPVLELPLDGEHGEVEVRHLAEGPLTVSVRIGRWFEEHLRLGSGTTEIVAGRETLLVLELAEGPELRVAPLSGTLVIPAGWELERPYLSFDLEGPGLGGRDNHFALYSADMRPVAGQPGVFAWSVPEAQLGKYEIELSEPNLSVFVELGPEGRSGVTIELPPPAEVQLRILDAATGLTADIAQIGWGPKRNRTTGSWSSSLVSRDERTETFRFIAFEGEIEVHPSGIGYGRPREVFRVREGLNELTMRVERQAGVLVVLKDGNAIVPWPSGARVYPERIDGDPGGWGMSTTSEGRRFTVPVDGLYRISIPDIDGFLPVPPLELRMTTADERTVEVPLVRDR